MEAKSHLDQNQLATLSVWVSLTSAWKLTALFTKSIASWLQMAQFPWKGKSLKLWIGKRPLKGIPAGDRMHPLSLWIVLLVGKEIHRCCIQRWIKWRIQDFPKGGVDPKDGDVNLLFWTIFPQNCMKMKKKWTGGCVRSAPPDPRNLVRVQGHPGHPPYVRQC